MGISENRFVNDVEKELFCPICNEVFEDPVQTMACQHNFCRRCLDLWLVDHDTCPLDRKNISRESVIGPNRLLIILLNKLSVSCLFTEQGCSEVIKYDLLTNHQARCEFNPNKRRPCKGGCGFELNKEEMAGHECVPALVAAMEKLNIEIEQNKYLIDQLKLENKEKREKLEQIAQEKEVVLKEMEERQAIIRKQKEAISTTRRLENLLGDLMILPKSKSMSWIDELAIDNRVKWIVKCVNVKAYYNLFKRKSKQKTAAKLLNALASKLSDGASVLFAKRTTGYFPVCLALMIGREGRVTVPEVVSEKTARRAISNIRKDRKELIESRRVNTKAGKGTLFDVVVCGKSSQVMRRRLMNSLDDDGKLVVLKKKGAFSVIDKVETD